MIYTFGGTLVDIICKNMQPCALKVGGSALNTSISLSRLGSKVTYISELGDDTTSTYCLEFLRENGICTDYIIQNHKRKTTLALAHLDEHNNATYDFYKDLPDFFTTEIPALNTNDIVLLSSSFAIQERTKTYVMQVLQKCKQKRVSVVYDPNMRAAIVPYSKEWNSIFTLFSYANIVRASHHDCMFIWGHTNTAEISKELFELGVSCFICTHAASHVEVFIKDNKSVFTLPEITTVSTIGAGDTFNAGLIHCMSASKDALQKEQLHATISFASHCASRVCMSIENYVTQEDVAIVSCTHNYIGI